MTIKKTKNKLQHEKSPYLLQHADNPIDWYPWNEEAFEKAKQEDKPIFLSIGYSTCHWCHVMARESFEDIEVADILNESFVAIKVDREERPDVDAIYMEVCQAMTGAGGWPLTILMTPDKVPFFAATYLPKNGTTDRYGLIEVLTIIETRWRTKREELLVTANKVEQYFNYREELVTHQTIEMDAIDKAFQSLKQQFDEAHGGFGEAPKFPVPHYYHFLIRYHIMKKDEKALHMLNKSLKAMIKGGIYDQIGSGFARYAVDRKWLIPHFEKMLYDNALMTTLLIEAHLHTQDGLYKRIAKDVLAFVERELMSEEGAFYTAIDADSEGIEGKFYRWTMDELRVTLDENEWKTIVDYYQVTEAGNFEGSTILNFIHLTDGALSKDEPKEIIRLKQKLLNARNKRIRPLTDDKVLTGINAMMVRAFVKAYKAFNQPHYLTIAERATQFLLKNLIREDGRLLARYRDGEAKFIAYSEDYAHLISALIDLFLATSKLVYLEEAIRFTDQFITFYHDSEHGGFFQTAHDAEELLTRNKEIFDASTPSANAVMALNFIRLAEITDEVHYENFAVEQFTTFGKRVADAPLAGLSLLTAFLMYKVPKRKIVLVTDEINEAIKELQSIVRNKCIPCTEMITLLKEDIIGNDFFSYYVEEERKMVLYICENYACSDPIYHFDEMKKALENLITMTLD